MQESLTGNNIHLNRPSSKSILLGPLAALMSYVFPFSLFAPVPLFAAFVLRGRESGVIIGLVCFFSLVFLSVSFNASYVGLVMFLCACLHCIFLYEVMKRKIAPANAVVIYGVVFFILFLIPATMYFLLENSQWRETLDANLLTFLEDFKRENTQSLRSIEQQSVIKSLFDNPAEFIKSLVAMTPFVFFLGFMTSLWMSFLLILRNSRLWRARIFYPFTWKSLIRFRAPEYFIIPIILSLALWLIGSYVGGMALFFGENLFYAISFFMFFQGLGLYSDLLDHLRIFGLIRLFLLMIILFLAFKFIVAISLIGMLDIWVNFRKFFIKKSENKT